MDSPFATHRDKVLGHSPTATWLRQFVLAMWDDNVHTVGLGRLASVDQAHFAAAMDMLHHFRRHGPRDPALAALVKEIYQHVDDQSGKRMRAAMLAPWMEAVGRQLREFGEQPPVNGDWDWFAAQFDEGKTAAQAVGEWRRKRH